MEQLLEKAFGEVVKEVKNSDYAIFEGKVLKETEKAIQARINVGASFYSQQMITTWIPKSVINITAAGIEVKKWFAEKNF